MNDVSSSQWASRAQSCWGTPGALQKEHCGVIPLRKREQAAIYTDALVNCWSTVIPWVGAGARGAIHSLGCVPC